MRPGRSWRFSHWTCSSTTPSRAFSRTASTSRIEAPPVCCIVLPMGGATLLAQLLGSTHRRRRPPELYGWNLQRFAFAFEPRHLECKSIAKLTLGNREPKSEKSLFHGRQLVSLLIQL